MVALAPSVRARLRVVALAGGVLAGLAIVLGTPPRGRRGRATFLLPWYLIWLLPLSARRRPSTAALALTAFIVTRIPLLLA